MAIAFTKTARLDEAIRHYRRALELDESLAGAHYGLAFLLLKRGDPDGAAQHLRAFLAQPPRGPDAATVGRARHAGAARAGRRAARRRPAAPALGGGALRRIAAPRRAPPWPRRRPWGCKALTPDFDAIIAIEVVVPDSGRLERGGHAAPPGARPERPRRLDRGRRSCGARSTPHWRSSIPSPATTLGRFVGTGRLQARAGTLRSSAVTITVRGAARFDRAGGSDPRHRGGLGPRFPLRQPADPAPSVPPGRRASVKIALSVARLPSGPAVGLTLVPGDTVRTNGTRDRGVPGAAHRGQAGLGRRDGECASRRRHAVGSPITFVVEFLP